MSASIRIPVVQERGLPPGCTVDDVIKWPTEGAKWLGVTVSWAEKHEDEIPGVIRETNKTKLFHPRTYLDNRLNPTRPEARR